MPVHDIADDFACLNIHVQQVLNLKITPSDLKLCTRNNAIKSSKYPIGY
jgi:hypothetical protein